ncbi:PIN-like domain-containing protein [Methylosinus sporium]|uniref:PIN-like domain-containing protein n=1 Tax=Methylosinus sporium TaxID=428 RepID=UPI001FEF431A|nr:PIN-like domain-containing protein [Methylosinus sporium]
MRLTNVKRRSGRAVRLPAVRQWSGPLIGREPEGVDDYLAKVARLVADVRTHLYFDASFLMWLAKLGEEARAEFHAWQSAVGESRFHVPLWAAHEFFKHRLKNTVSKELGKEIRAFDSAASNLYEALRIYCSDQLFGFKNSGVLFLDEYRRTVQPVRAMLKVAEKSEQFAAGVRQVSTYIDERLLSGPLYEVVADIEADERVRNRGVIPPSFKDAHKRGGKRTDDAGEEPTAGGDNSFGDLVFWREVLRHAASVRARTVIVLTADRKNDWFENHHGDQGLTETVRKRILRPRPVPTPHPLLVREAFDRGAGDLALIDPMYCGVLLERTGGTFANFAAAALDTHLPEPVKKPAAARSWAKRFGAEAHLLGGGRVLEGDEDEFEKEQFDAASLVLEHLRPSSRLREGTAEVIRRIAEADLAARTQAFRQLDNDALEQWDIASLVALGRVALRTAEAGDPASLDFLSDLRDHAPEFAAAVREPIYFGALGAVYFDDELARRPPQGSQAAVVLLSLVTAPEVRHSAAALGAALGAESKLFYRPGPDAAILSVEFVIQPSADNKSAADLLAIKLDGVDLMTNLQTEEPLRFTSLLGKPPGVADLQVGALLEVLTRYHLLPRQLIETDINTDLIVRVPEYAGVELDV